MRRLIPELDSTSSAKLIPFTIFMAADAAGDTGFERSILCGKLGVRFHGEALHGLQGRGDGFLIGFRPPHLRIEPLVDLPQSRIVRTDDGHAIGILCGRRLAEFLFSIH